MYVCVSTRTGSVGSFVGDDIFFSFIASKPNEIGRGITPYSIPASGFLILFGRSYHWATVLPRIYLIVTVGFKVQFKFGAGVFWIVFVFFRKYPDFSSQITFFLVLYL